MMNLLNGDKKKGITMILESEGNESENQEKKESGGKEKELAAIAFDALKSGDKERFSKALSSMVEICVLNNKMED